MAALGGVLPIGQLVCKHTALAASLPSLPCVPVSGWKLERSS